MNPPNKTWDHEAFTDANNNGVRDAGEAFTDANSNGSFDAETFVISDAAGKFAGLGGTGTIVAAALRDSSGNSLSRDFSTGLVFDQVYSAPEGSSVINPLTSLVAAQLGANPTAAQVAAAEQQVAQVFGITLPAGTRLTDYDPLAVAGSTTATAAQKTAAVEFQKVAAQIANTVEVLSAALVGASGASSASAAASQVIASIANLIQGGATSLNFSSSTTLITLASAVANDVGGGAQTELLAEASNIATSLSNINTLISQVDSSSATSITLSSIAAMQEVAQSTLANAVQSAASSTDILDTTSFTGSALSDLVTQAASTPPDTLAPTVTIASNLNTLTSGQNATITLTFSEAPTGFTVSDLSVSGGSISNLAVDPNNPAVYTATFAATANTSGTASIQVTMAYTDAAGNGGGSSNTLSITYDNAVPAAPTSTLTTDTGTSTSDKITSNGALTVSGTEANATVEYSTDGTAWASGFTPVTGSNTVHVRQIDVAGNASAASAAYTFTLDTAVPSAPTLATYANSSSKGITVVAETGSTVGIYNTSNADVSSSFSLLGTADNGNGTSTYTFKALQIGTFGLTVKAVDAAGNASIVSNGVTLSVPVSGVLVDGYIGGAKIYQDANGNKKYDSGEVSTTSKATGEFELNITSTNNGKIRVEGGLDIGSNEPVKIDLSIDSLVAGNNFITPLSTVASAAKDANANLTDAQVESRVAVMFDVDLAASVNQSIFGYDPVAALASSNSTESTAARETYSANQMVVAIGHSVGAAVERLASDAIAAIEAHIVQAASAASVTIGSSVSITADASWDGIAQSSVVEALGETIASTADSSLIDATDRNTFLNAALAKAGLQIAGELQSALETETVVVNGVTKTYAQLLAQDLNVVDLNALIQQFVDAKQGRAEVISQAAAEKQVADWQQSLGSISDAEGLAKAITVVSVAGKNIDADTLGNLVQDDGTPVSGQTADSVKNAVTSNANQMSQVAQETIGDVFGAQTRSKYADAVIQLLTEDNDSFTGQDVSEIIAALRGQNTVDGRGGDDKILGGPDDDILAGGNGDDEIYGFRGNDTLSGDAGNDFISAGAGNDIVNGGTGDDTLLGEDGNDTLLTRHDNA